MDRSERAKGRRLAVGYLRARRLASAWYPPPGLNGEAAVVMRRLVQRWRERAQGQLEAHLWQAGEPVVVQTRRRVWVFTFGPTSDGLIELVRPRKRVRRDGPHPQQGGPYTCSA